MINAPLIPISELTKIESLSKYGNIGYRTRNFQRIILVKVMGYITDIIDNDDRGFTFLRLDDGTSSILIKIFGESEKRKRIVKNIKKWDYVLVIGFVRHWGEEFYIQPVNIKKLNLKEEIYYKLKLIKEYYMNFLETI